jgi:S-adenosyl methyltransferase
VQPRVAELCSRCSRCARFRPGTAFWPGVAARTGSDRQVVYVDNDPLVLAHARALLTSSPEGATAYLDADLRDTGKILGQAAALEQTLNRHLPGEQHTARPRGDVESLFAGTRLLSPGVVPVSQWRPATADEAAVPTTLWGGIGSK